MPDHLHLIWMGVAPESDQRRASTFLRNQLEPLLAPHRLQHQAYDHVLRSEEREQGAFTATCHYIADNPVPTELVSDRTAWPYTGSLVPGYFALHPLETGYWEKFWRIYTAAVQRGGIGKLDAP